MTCPTSTTLRDDRQHRTALYWAAMNMCRSADYERADMGARLLADLTFGYDDRVAQLAWKALGLSEVKTA